MINPTLDDIFERSIPEPNTGCWLWLGAWDNYWGYGFLNVNGTVTRVHRTAYALANPCEEITDLVVRHKCDVPLCVNPSHLEIGTHKDNTQDAVRKGRMAKGNAHGKMKIPDEELPNIRQMHAEGISQTDIAIEYGVSRFAIRRIVYGMRT